MTETAYETTFGRMLRGTAIDYVEEGSEQPQLILTSPPWCKEDQSFESYLLWQNEMFSALVDEMPPTSSLVVVHGQEWKTPFQSSRPLVALGALQAVLPLSQQFVVALDEPVISLPVLEQVASMCADKLRVWPKHMHAWWYGVMAMTNKSQMPSSSVIEIGTNEADRRWRRAAADAGLLVPSAWPVSVAAAFVLAFTQPGDLVLDPFAGSNATGFACEQLGRRWVAVEPDDKTIEGSMLRFDSVRL